MIWKLNIQLNKTIFKDDINMLMLRYVTSYDLLKVNNKLIKSEENTPIGQKQAKNNDLQLNNQQHVSS